MIKITHMLYSKRAFGVSLDKLKEGENVIDITVKDSNGNRLVAEPIKVTKQKLLNIYEVVVINKKDLRGVFIPLADIIRGVFDA